MDDDIQEAQKEQELGDEVLKEYLTDLSERQAWKEDLRKANLNVDNRPEESDFHRLDSSLKKNTAFVRKIKNFSESQKASIMTELKSLNLTKYIGEVTSAIVTAKLKMSDLNAMIEVCSRLHQTYAEFSALLLSAWLKIFTFRKEEKLSNPSKLRVDLRLYSELISVGVFTLKDGLPLLGNALTTLVAIDKEDHSNIAIILAFCRFCGYDYAGLIPRKIKQVAEKTGETLPVSSLLSPEKQKNVRQMLRDYFTSVCKHLVAEHSEMVSVERTNRRILLSKGEVHEERKERAQLLQVAFAKLLQNTQMLADILDLDMPELVKEDIKNNDDELDLFTRGSEDAVSNLEEAALTSLWEDDDMKSFYENLVDLKPIVPAILYKKAAEEVTKAVEPEAEEEYGNEEMGAEEPEVDMEEEPLPPNIEDEAEDSENLNTPTRVLLDAYLANLSLCVNREMIDNAAADFCMNLNTKSNRRKLVKALFSVHRNRQDLLPFYSRLVATLHPLMPDVAADLAQYLKQEFRWQLRKKDQMKIESKLKVCRFIGELVKFKMFSKNDCMFCMKHLLFDFSHHHIEMACTLMEVCGKFLYLSPESHQRTRIYLEQMMRKKQALSLDARYIMMIENAYYTVIPPEVTQEAQCKRPPLYLYVQKLLFSDLTKSNTEKILKQIRKLPWDQPGEVSFVVELLCQAWNLKYYNIRHAASVMAGLIYHHDWIGPRIVDNLLEDIRLGMEMNNPKFYQRRIAVIKLLAELYNYKVVDSSVIFKVLYSLIAYGNSIGDLPGLDPPDHLLRVRMICVILDTCGAYFNSVSNKKKLDYFITYFQLYYLKKKTADIWTLENPFPFSIASQFEETIPVLRPNLQLFESVKAAQAAVDKMEKEMLSKIHDRFPHLRQLEISNQASENLTSQHSGIQDMLSTINEEGSVMNEEEEDESQSASRSRSTSQMEFEDDDEDEVEAEDNDDDNEEEEEDDDDEEEEEEEEEREEVVVNSQEEEEANAFRSKINEEPEDLHVSMSKHIRSDEDDAFISMFDKMLNENIVENRSAASKQMVQVPSALSRPLHAKKSYDHLKPPESEPMVSTVQFSVLMRKGTKATYKEVAVDMDSDMAKNLLKQEAADRLEKERVKKLTLEMNERQEEEDLHEAIASSQRPGLVNLNHERRARHHPIRGTPDVDLIFGNTKSTR